MTVSRAVGLPPFAEVLFGHSFWTTFCIYLFITMGATIVIGIVGESRMIPLTPDKQFLGFCPGDICFSVGAAGLTMVASTVTRQLGAHNMPATQALLMLAAVGFVGWITWDEWQRGDYPSLWALLSPVKVYHTLMFAVLAYVMLALLVAAAFGHGVTWGTVNVLAILIGFGGYAYFISLDERKTDVEKAAISAHAVISDWVPLPVTLWRMAFAA